MKIWISILTLFIATLAVAQESANCECKEEGTVTDFDGNSYKTVKIGEQWWMAQNLRTTHFCDGSNIFNSMSYDNDKVMDRIYGRYYNWETATKGEVSNKNPSGVQGVCPCDWHIPSDEEWMELERFLGMSKEERMKFGGRGDVKKGVVRQICDPNYFMTALPCNCTKLSLIPAGLVVRDKFSRVGEWAYYTSSSKVNPDKKYFISRLIDNTGGPSQLVREERQIDPLYYISVRCIKD